MLARNPIFIGAGRRKAAERMHVIPRVLGHRGVNHEVHDLAERTKQIRPQHFPVIRVGLDKRLVVKAPRIVPGPEATGIQAALAPLLHPSH
jgi:hypothetical protein